MNASPWWYRHRGSVIGAIFGVGFFAGNVRIDGTAPLPAAVIWGERWGDRGVEALLWIGIVFTLLAWLVRRVGLYAPPLGFAIIVLGNVVFGAMLAREEVRRLGSQYGADYTAYRAAVPAFLPRIAPATFASTGTVQPDLRRAFFAESFTLALAIALMPIAIAGRSGMLVAAIIFVIAMALFVAASRMGRRTAS